MYNMPGLNQRGIANLLVPIILILGLIAGVYLVTSGNPLNLFSKASKPLIVLKDLSGNVLPQKDGIYQSASKTVKVELTSTLGAPGKNSNTATTNSSVYTVAYKIADNPTDLASSPQKSYLVEPTVLTYTFKDTSLGKKFIWVEFIASNGKTDRRTAQIELIANPKPTPTPGLTFSVGTNVTGITHYGYTDNNSFCYANAGYAIEGAPLPSPGKGGGGTNLYVDPNKIGLLNNASVIVTADPECSGNIKPVFAAGLENCKGGCGDGKVKDGCTCGGGNPKDKRACWWRWTCKATTQGSYTATFNSVFLPSAPASNVDSDLAEMQRMGMKIIRIFAGNKHIDDNEAARRLGVFLDKANGYGISVIVSLIDYYNSGYAPQGVEKYYTGNWKGIGLLGHEFFDTGYKGRYKDFVRSIVTANKNKSNIYAWEPGNELTDNPSTFLSFMKDITGMIKSIDPQHAIAAGVLNFDQSFYSKLPNVDIVTVHTYDGDRSGAAEVAWAKSNNKRAIVEEFGLSGWDDRSAGIRNELNYWKNQGALAVLHWGFIAKGLPDNGNGDNKFGMDTIWHAKDYDALASLYQKFNISGR